MAFLLVNSGAEKQARVKLGKDGFSQWTVGLFSNNHTPTLTDILANYTLGAYASEQNVDNTTWTGSVSGGIWTGTCNPLVFTLAGGYSGSFVYGYYIRDQTSTLLGAELYLSPYALPSVGGLWSVALQDTFHG